MICKTCHFSFFKQNLRIIINLKFWFLSFHISLQGFQDPLNIFKFTTLIRLVIKYRPGNRLREKIIRFLNKENIYFEINKFKFKNVIHIIQVRK